MKSLLGTPFLSERQVLRLCMGSVCGSWPSCTTKFFRCSVCPHNSERFHHRVICRMPFSHTLLPHCLTFSLSGALHRLQRGDRMSMAHSLEARVPFLDTDLVDAVMAVDPALKSKTTCCFLFWRLETSFPFLCSFSFNFSDRL